MWLFEAGIRIDGGQIMYEKSEQQHKKIAVFF
jgi:hypothetical protein